MGRLRVYTISITFCYILQDGETEGTGNKWVADQ